MRDAIRTMDDEFLIKRILSKWKPVPSIVEAVEEACNHDPIFSNKSNLRQVKLFMKETLEVHKTGILALTLIVSNR